MAPLFPPVSPSFFGDDYIPSMLKAVGGVPVIAGGIESIGIVDYVDELALAQMGVEGIIGKAIVCTVQTRRFSDLRIGDPINVEGVSYVIRDRRAIDDGALTQLFCQVPR